MIITDSNKVKAARLTPSEQICFFGYYDKSALSENDEYLLFHRTAFQDRAPNEDDSAEICLMEIPSRRIISIGKTFAWNFQQGAMLQWLPGNRIVYNIRTANKFCARVYEPEAKHEDIIERPVSAVSRDVRFALSINFARLATHRPGYGYEGLADEFGEEKWPADDGIYLIDLQSGKRRLIISLESMLKFRDEEGIQEQLAWFNHTSFSPDGKKFVFLNRWMHEDRHRTAMFVSDRRGKHINSLLEGNYVISHFDWKNNSELVVWAEVEGQSGFYTVNAESGAFSPVAGEIQKSDGHCSTTENEKFMLVDSYPINQHRNLAIFDTETGRQIELGRFYSPPEITGPFRCDLHPRWSSSEKYITFDSAHEGERAVYWIRLELMEDERKWKE